MIIPLILAGGTGTRLWPLSRKSKPKQTLKLTNQHTLFQSTLLNLDALHCATPLVIGNYDYRFILAEQLRMIDHPATILLEAVGRNTAAAIAIGTLFASMENEDPLILVLPSDHYISDPEKFSKMIHDACDAAQNGKLVTFGVPPTHAETGFGYIQKGNPLLPTNGFLVKHFVEKPDYALAQTYLKSGDYFWNSGIFLFRASVLIHEFKKYAPIILSAAEQTLKSSHCDENFVYLKADDFQNCPSLPIDRAIFEKTTEAVVFPFKSLFKDLGSFEALYDIGEKDARGNVIIDQVIPYNTKNCYLHSQKQLLVTAGIENCLVVTTDDAVLVARLDEKQDMKHILEQLIFPQQESVL